MAVEVEFENVIIRKSALGVKFPGGLDAFAATELPNFIEDDQIVRIGFMSTEEACRLADKLTQYGLVFDDTSQSDVAVVCQDSHPDWLMIGCFGKSIGCWLAGADPGPLVRCRNGFILRCPRELFDRLELVLGSMGIAVVRSELPHGDEKETDRTVNFSRCGGSITANIVSSSSNGGPVVLWATSDCARREKFRSDVQLIEEIECKLLANGAER